MRRYIAATLGLTAVYTILGWAATASAAVLRVGAYHGIRGQYTTIQAAVDAARPGDWILIGPGDYKTTTVSAPKGKPDFPAAVLITTRDLHIRGMNRRTVIVDGTKRGSAACSRAPGAQNFGLAGGRSGTSRSIGRYAVTAAARRSGLNGLMVWKADNVTIENLTACNFLGGARVAGNQIWWNGGAGSGRVGGHGFFGSYLTATSTYFGGEKTAATYGIFSSNWSGGTWDQTYASNFNDSGYYIGACKQSCDQTVNHAWAEYNALGYSGSNSGGTLIVKNSEWDRNQEGFNTNSQNGDDPAPQNGACPGNAVSPITHTHSCWVFMHNFVHDNNNPNVPSAGGAAAGPVGTGLVIAGGRNDTVIDNRFVDNKAWGALVVNYPDSGKPCIGGTLNSPLLGKGSCLFDEWGDAVLSNSFTGDGAYGNPTNGDFEQLNFESHPSDCFRGNFDTAGSLTAVSAALEAAYPTCTTTPVAPNFNVPFLNEVLCDSAINLAPFGCQPGDHYPTRTRVVMHPLPAGLKSMPSPCAGVPGNPWCTRRTA